MPEPKSISISLGILNLSSAMFKSVGIFSSAVSNSDNGNFSVSTGSTRNVNSKVKSLNRDFIRAFARLEMFVATLFTPVTVLLIFSNFNFNLLHND